MSDSTLISVADAAALLQVHEQTVRLAIRRGEIPATRLGNRKFLIPRESMLERFTNAAIANCRESDKG